MASILRPTVGSPIFLRADLPAVRQVVVDHSLIVVALDVVLLPHCTPVVPHLEKEIIKIIRRFIYM